MAWLGLVSLAWCLLFYNEGIPYPGWAALLPVMATVLIVVGCTARTESSAPGPARLLSVGPMRHIGRVSYSWYLWHWPLLVLPAVALGHALSVPEAVLAVAASYLLALASYHLVESRVRFAPRLRGYRPAMALGVALTALALVAAGGLAKSATRGVELTGRVDATTEVSTDVFLAAPKVTVDMKTGDVSTPPVLTPSALEGADDYGALFDQDCQSHLLDVVVKECAFGDLTSDKTVVVFGDSHASAWTPGLEIVAVQRGWKLVPMTKGRCAPGDFPVYDEQLKRAYRECDTWRQAALTKMREIKPDLIIMGGLWHSMVAGADGNAITGDASRQPVADGTASMARELTTLGAPVVFMRDWPAPGFEAPACIAKHPDDYAACSFSRADRFPQDQATLAAVKGVPGVRIIDLTRAICAPATKSCASVVQNILRYRGREPHLSDVQPDARPAAPEGPPQQDLRRSPRRVRCCSATSRGPGR